VINLVNGRVFDNVLTLGSDDFFIGSLSYGECKDPYRTKVDQAIANGSLSLLDDSRVSATRFADLLNQYSLGDGETECLLFTTDLGYSMASDDRKARTIAQSQAGESRVTGSLGLLRKAVRAGKLSQQNAMDAYTKMLESGGFLPGIDVNFFT